MSGQGHAVMTGAEKARIMLGGVAGPVLMVLGGWWWISSWRDLPPEVPSHWTGGTADGFSDPGTVIRSWLFGAVFMAAVTVVLTIANALGWQWSAFARGVSAVGIGATGAVVAGLVLSLLVTRGATVAEASELGAWPGFLGVFGGFVVFLVLGLWVLPRGRAV